MSDDTLDLSDSTAEFKITVNARKILVGISRWALFTAITGFCLTLCGLAFMAFIYIENMNRTYYNDDFIFGLLIFGAAAVIIFLIAKFLLDYSRNLKRSILQNSEIHLEKALKGLRNALIMTSIIWFVALGFFVFLIVVLTLLNGRF